MLLIECPWCGKRAQTEFTYIGDASLKRPHPTNDTDKVWADFIYLRANPKGLHREYWHHSEGCRQFLMVLRNVVTHEIISTAKPNETLEKNK